MKQLFASLLLALFFAAGCSKEDKKTDPPVETIALSIDTAQVLPGDAVMIKSGKPITTAEVNITLNGATVKGYASGDSAYVFIVPVIAPGTVSLSIPAIPNSNTLSLEVKNYTRISDPQPIIDEYVAKRNKSIDSVTKTVAGSNFQLSPQSIVLLNQIKEEWDVQMSNLSATDKELLAYVLQRNMPDPSQYSFEELPAGYFAKPGDVKGDVGDKLVAMAKAYVTVQSVCIGTIPFLIASGVSFVIAPNPVSALVFLGVFTTFIISRESAIRRAQEVGRLKGVAEAVLETDALKPAEFFNNSEKSLSMSVGFRNLSTTDASLQQDITSAFTTEQSFINKDKEVETMYAKATAKTTKLKGAYPSYAGIIGKQAKGTMTLSIEGSNIQVKGVSDPRIGYSSTLSGTTKKVKITSTATTEINFNLQVAYKRTLDGKEFTKDIACLYKPEFDSTALYKASAIGNYTVNGPPAVGNGPNSRLYCELKAGGIAVYTIYDDPSWPNGYSWNIGWSVSKLNNRYYILTGWTNPGYLQAEAQPLTYPVTNFVYRHSYSK